MYRINIALILVIFALFSVGCSEVLASQCYQFDGMCVRCSPITHLYDGLCYRNIPGCVRYSKGDQCSSCNQTISTLVNGTCEIFSEILADLQSSSSNSELDLNNIGQQYGGAAFRRIEKSEAKQMQTFRQADIFLRNSQQGYRLQRSQDPVLSVYTYMDQNGNQRFKIIYYGQAGGIYMCFVTVNPITFAKRLQSFTQIDVTTLIDYCVYYEQSVCVECQRGFHLYDGVCYRSTGVCIQYKFDICLKCLPNYFLIENRCINDCISISDTRSILHYQRNNVCSLQIFTGISISKFY